MKAEKPEIETLAPAQKKPAGRFPPVDGCSSVRSFASRRLADFVEQAIDGHAQAVVGFVAAVGDRGAKRVDLVLADVGDLAHAVGKAACFRDVELIGDRGRSGFRRSGALVGASSVRSVDRLRSVNVRGTLNLHGLFSRAKSACQCVCRADNRALACSLPTWCLVAVRAASLPRRPNDWDGSVSCSSGPPVRRPGSNEPYEGSPWDEKPHGTSTLLQVTSVCDSFFVGDNRGPCRVVDLAIVGKAPTVVRSTKCRRQLNETPNPPLT
jgi:hypothetical protein